MDEEILSSSRGGIPERGGGIVHQPSIQERLNTLTSQVAANQKRTDNLFYEISTTLKEVIALERQIIDLIAGNPPAARLVLTLGNPQPQNIG